jgi:hypothetical protein
VDHEQFGPVYPAICRGDPPGLTKQKHIHNAVEVLAASSERGSISMISGQRLWQAPVVPFPEALCDILLI